MSILSSFFMMHDTRHRDGDDDEDTGNSGSAGTTDDPLQPDHTNKLPDDIGTRIGESSTDDVVGEP
jgi:hypothetical protein